MADYVVSVEILAQDRATEAIANLNRELQNVAANSETNANQVVQQKSLWEQYSGAVQSVATAYGVVQSAAGMLGQGLELVDLGENVRSVRLAFEALADDPATAAANLQLYRDATRNVISDMELMTASNRMGSMGLAETSEDMAELLRMAQALGSVMSPGATAAQNIDNFTLLLANQSVRRLDSFGISADAVRQRIEELKEEGYSAQEAFTRATLEQGRIALENLGAAADAGATSVDRLSTRWQNFFNNFAEGVANVVDEAAGTVEMLAGMGAAQQAVYEATGDPRQYGVGFGDAAVAMQDQYGYGTEDAALVNMYGAPVNSQRAIEERAAIQAQMEYEALAEARAAIVVDAVASGGAGIDAFGGGGNPLAFAGNMFGGAIGDITQVWQSFDMSSLVSDANAFAAGFETAADRATAFSNAMSDVRFTVLPISEMTAQIANGMDTAAVASEALKDAMGAYDLTGYGGADLGGTQLFRPEEVQAIQEASTYYSDLLADAQAMYAQGLISDATLASVQTAADDTARLADNAQRGADAYANMSLSQAFQTQGGGMMGEMSSDVIAEMQDNGANASTIAATQQQFGLASGQITASSMIYEQQVVPIIADIASQYGAQAAADAMANVQSYMQNAAYMGLGDGQMAGGMMQATGFTYANSAEEDQMMAEGQIMGGGTLTQATPLSEMAEMNEQMDAMSAASADFTSNLEAGSVAMAEMKGDMRSVVSDAAQLSSRLNTINGRNLNVRLNIQTAGAQDAIMALIQEALGNLGSSGGGSTPNPHPGGGGP